MSASTPDLTALVEQLAETKTANCYQCGKCTAGCPRSEMMDVPPTRLMRLTQTGDILEAASAASIWQCVSCQTCSVRCPKSVHVAGVVDALRQIALQENTVARKMKNVVLFQQEFLNNIRRNGRTNELELVGWYKVKGFFQSGSIPGLFADTQLGPKMLSRGKLHFNIGSPVKDKAVVQRIFERCGY
ncbi:MAG: 4Fe-4S dicluster domain-containing protein [Thermoguttaceae bacterium]|nr:4Fe-4S dicluster domain-containing protein [Thermoguttaceae bacterium]